jgi:hypothetical protein
MCARKGLVLFGFNDKVFHLFFAWLSPLKLEAADDFSMTQA